MAFLNINLWEFLFAIFLNFSSLLLRFRFSAISFHVHAYSSCRFYSSRYCWGNSKWKELEN